MVASIPIGRNEPIGARPFMEAHHGPSFRSPLPPHHSVVGPMSKKNFVENRALHLLAPSKIPSQFIFDLI